MVGGVGCCLRQLASSFQCVYVFYNDVFVGMVESKLSNRDKLFIFITTSNGVV